MLIRPSADILPSEITDPDVYRARRRFIAQAGGLALATALPAGHAHAALGPLVASTPTPTSSPSKAPANTAVPSSASPAP